MNKLLIKCAGLCCAVFFLTTSLNAQHCSELSIADNGSSVKLKAGSGFSGSYSLPCIDQGNQAQIELPFQVFNTIARGSNDDQVYKMRIDKITNIPSGMCWVSSREDRTFEKGTGGLLVFKGTTKDEPGQYNLVVTVSFDTDGNGDFDREAVNYNKVSKTGKMVLRVANGTVSCQPIDYETPGNTAGVSRAEGQ